MLLSIALQSVSVDWLNMCFTFARAFRWLEFQTGYFSKNCLWYETCCSFTFFGSVTRLVAQRLSLGDLRLTTWNVSDW